MEKITLNEYLKQGSVVENLKNFVGVTPENTMGLMTPERLAAVAGELGKFPMMKQGPIRDGLMKDGCAYVYGDVDNSKVTGPCISMAAGEGSSIQIKSSHRGDVFMFRVKNIEDHSWSEWKVLSIKG